MDGVRIPGALWGMGMTEGHLPSSWVPDIAFAASSRTAPGCSHFLHAGKEGAENPSRGFPTDSPLLPEQLSQRCMLWCPKRKRLTLLMSRNLSNHATMPCMLKTIESRARSLGTEHPWCTDRLQLEEQKHDPGLPVVPSSESDKRVPFPLSVPLSGVPCPIIIAWAIGKLYYEDKQ